MKPRNRRLKRGNAVFKFISRIFRKIFRRPENVDEYDVTKNIISSISSLSKEGKVIIYNGTLSNLRIAQSDPYSTIYIVEIINEPERSTFVDFDEYIEKLKNVISTKPEDKANHHE